MPTILQSRHDAAQHLLDLMQRECPQLYRAFMEYKPFVNCRPGWQEWIPFPSIHTPQAENFLPLVNRSCDHFGIPAEEANWVALAARQIKDGVELRVLEG